MFSKAYDKNQKFNLKNMNSTSKISLGPFLECCHKCQSNVTPIV